MARDTKHKRSLRKTKTKFYKRSKSKRVSNSKSKNLTRRRTRRELREKAYNAHMKIEIGDFPLFHVNLSKTSTEKQTYAYLFDKLEKEYNRYSRPNSNWQFLEVFLYKDTPIINGEPTETYKIMFASPYHLSTNRVPILPTGFASIDYDPVMFNAIKFHIKKIIKEGSLGIYMKALLDKNYMLRISLDYYKGRALSQAGFHKDTRETFGFYTALTFNIPENEYVPGPELTHYNTVCNRRGEPGLENFPRQVFRPVIYGPYGTAGFNDMIMLHSTPYTADAENIGIDTNGFPLTIFNVPMKFAVYPGYDEIAHSANPALQQNLLFTYQDESIRIKPSKHRTKYVPTSANRPPFIRCWFEAFMDTDYIEHWVHNNQAIVFYDNAEENFDNAGIVEYLKPKQNIRNVVIDNNQFSDLDIFDLGPELLDSLLEQTCERAQNMGGRA